MSGLPSGYTQLEYIESSGTQYVDTGFKPNQDSRIVADMDIVGYSGQSAVLGSRNGLNTGGFALFTYNNNAGYQNDYASRQNFPIGGNSAGRHLIDKNKNTLVVDGTTIDTVTPAKFSVNHTAFLFQINNNGSNMVSGCPTSAKLYSSQLYDNGNLIRDFVPCIDPIGTVGLYDQVDGKFYANAGTGTFTAGPEIIPDPPAAPTGLQTVLAVVLQWAASANADRYDVYRDGAKLGSTEGTQYVDTTPEANQTYVYTVKAVNGGGESAGASITVYTRSGYFEYKPLIESANFP